MPMQFWLYSTWIQQKDKVAVVRINMHTRGSVTKVVKCSECTDNGKALLFYDRPVRAGSSEHAAKES
jgi:hypothetical protein